MFRSATLGPRRARARAAACIAMQRSQHKTSCHTWGDRQPTPGYSRTSARFEHSDRDEEKGGRPGGRAERERENLEEGFSRGRARNRREKRERERRSRWKKEWTKVESKIDGEERKEGEEEKEIRRVGAAACYPRVHARSEAVFVKPGLSR